MKSPSHFIFSASPLSYQDDELSPAFIKQQIKQFQYYLAESFKAGCTANELVMRRSTFVDELLQRLWQYFGFTEDLSSDSNTLTLIAVGGYGRQELHPLSDIDILILSDSDHIQQYHQISQFIALLWDVGLQVGHSVRSLPECVKQAKQDLTIATNLLEARFIAGNAALFTELNDVLWQQDVWPFAPFFHAKVAEQTQRHQHYHATSYNLEPDIKANPGGLRDIHTLQWLCKRYFHSNDFYTMVTEGFLTLPEYHELIEYRDFLWHIRFALHLVVPRYENRLLFEHQLNVAQLLNYTGSGNQPVELMMKSFFCVTQQVIELNRLLLQLFEEKFLTSTLLTFIDLDEPHFYQKGDHIALKEEYSFNQQPTLVLTLFLLLCTHPQLKTIDTQTLRQLRQALQSLPQPLCYIPEARAIFLTILQQPQGVADTLLKMHQHRVLTAYIPQWQQIVGLMQFDLFHAYTVDEHSIRVIIQLEKFNDTENNQLYPLCVKYFNTLSRHDLLYIAALFHDIAKGKSGDHSLLGADEVTHFMQLHEFSAEEITLVAWLVKNHLLMSITTQRRDIYDADVILQFAKEVKSTDRLHYLLCLTVADICATNDNLWNSWKKSLIQELCLLAEKQLNIGINTTQDLRHQIQSVCEEAKTLLAFTPAEQTELKHLWLTCRANYFLRHTAKQLAWHASHLINHADKQQPLILVSRKPTRGGTEIFIYCQDKSYLFASVVSELERKKISIHDAQIITNRDGMAMDTFVILEQDGSPLTTLRQQQIKTALEKALTNPYSTLQQTRKPSYKLRHFKVKTRINFLPEKNNRYTCMELFALDQPGLLAKIGSIFAEQNLLLLSAKITTIGERVEDFFIITDQHQLALSADSKMQLQDKIIETLAH